MNESTSNQEYFTCVYCRRQHSRTADTCPVTRRFLYGAHKLWGTAVADDSDYRVGRFLGEGERSVNYACEHVPTAEHCAVKFLKLDLRHYLEARDSYEQFKREAWAVEIIGHRNITGVRRVGTTPGGIPFVIMDLLHGVSLGGFLARWGRIPLKDAVQVMTQVLEGLEAAHNHGIVHRDLRPSNIFLTRDPGCPPAVKLLDFGLSRIASRVEVFMTTSQPGYVPPIPFYISPEQAQGDESIDHRADLFSAGAVLYELLTGARPFSAGSYGRQLVDIIRTPLPDPRVHLAGLPATAVEFLNMSMAKDRSDRFQSAGDMLRELRLLEKDHESPERETDATDALVIPIWGPPVTDEVVGAHRDFSTLRKKKPAPWVRRPARETMDTPPPGKKPVRRYEEIRTPDPFLWH
jgi:serine/threonine protein kinase